MSSAGSGAGLRELVRQLARADTGRLRRMALRSCRGDGRCPSACSA